MPEIKINCPAKINLTLEILDKREDGFHNIQSIMQTINLFDVLTIKIEQSKENEIELSGTSKEIPYNEKNLVYKAASLFLEKTGIENQKISIHIEKNIPISAGLAGGSTDAAGTLYGLNKLFDEMLSKEEIHELCAKLGSDLNFCLEGGCQLATSRGEILEKLATPDLKVSLIKPLSLGISAKEAYQKFSALEKKPNLNKTKKLKKALNKMDKKQIEAEIHNDLEVAIIDDYKELQEIKKLYTKSLMSGSGSTFFALEETEFKNSENFWVKSGLKTIDYGVKEV